MGCFLWRVPGRANGIVYPKLHHEDFQEQKHLSQNVRWNFVMRTYTNLAFKIAYLPVHFASLCVDHPRDSAAIPAVIALIETK